MSLFLRELCILEVLLAALVLKRITMRVSNSLLLVSVIRVWASNRQEIFRFAEFYGIWTWVGELKIEHP
ncbi:hypothetical protein M758_7G182800 [Ceratodon purpureus]|uniref:Secreted protein n=1 Tax=Ceratodon purpureus TaxID=3225 RepID=A0A8T0HCQ0_CERPU|nr:hypothetical protein KC19_7G185200 [Ceratodon purpureus]KAG0612003.1 hypothetical protein M758_7G182800 [Ceratodon purpureus]